MYGHESALDGSQHKCITYVFNWGVVRTAIYTSFCLIVIVNLAAEKKETIAVNQIDDAVHKHTQYTAAGRRYK